MQKRSLLLNTSKGEVNLEEKNFMYHEAGVEDARSAIK
jgi:hypothetical protein